MDPEMCEGEFPSSAFHCACRCGHLDIVKYFVEDRNCNLECKDKGGDHPLHQAIQAGHLNIVQYLIEERGANPMSTGENNRNAFHYSCLSGSIDMLRYMEEKCSTLSWEDVDSDGLTPLHLAAHGTLNMVKYLIDNKLCKVKCRDRFGNTPLHHAAAGGKLETVRYLIHEQGFDPEITNEIGKAPLHVACITNSVDVVKFLMEEKGVELLCQEKDGNSPLHIAAAHGSLDVVKYLCEEKHCDLGCYNKYQSTPLHSAAERGNLDIVKYLIEEQNCDPRCRGMKFGSLTPLFAACFSGALNVVRYLMEESQASCDFEEGKFSPLHFAAGNGQLQIVRLLVEEYQCDPNAKDHLGRTATTITKLYGQARVHSYLMGIKMEEGQRNVYIRKAQPTGKVLGSGTYGRVLEMISERGRVMAGKIFRLPAASAQPQDKLAHSMQREMMTMVQLQHPNIVEYIGVCYLPDQSPLPVLLMEKLMTSLHAYLLDPANCDLGVIRKLSFLLDTARGLEYLHSRTPAIIHRDLTARNVLLDFQLRAKLSDFGNARIMDLDPNATPGTSTAQPGTLDYMPPETIGGGAISEPSLDVFSFGHLALFTLLQTLLRPLLPPTYTDSNGKIQGRSEVERREKFVKKARSIPLGRPLLDLISQCLQNEPSQRPKSGELLPRLQEMKKTLGKWHATMQ